MSQIIVSPSVTPWCNKKNKYFTIYFKTNFNRQGNSLKYNIPYLTMFSQIPDKHHFILHLSRIILHTNVTLHRSRRKNWLAQYQIQIGKHFRIRQKRFTMMRCRDKAKGVHSFTTSPARPPTIDVPTHECCTTPIQENKRLSCTFVLIIVDECGQHDLQVLLTTRR